jgi:hypothetical protein
VVDHEGLWRAIDLENLDSDLRVCRSVMQDTDGTMLDRLIHLRATGVGVPDPITGMKAWPTGVDVYLTARERDQLVQLLLAVKT